MREVFRSRGSKPFLSLILFCLTILGTGQIASAQSVTFAQVIQTLGGQDFTFTNNGGASGTFATVPGGTPVFFLYQNIVGLDPSLQGFQNARLTVVSSTTTQPGSLGGSSVDQPLNMVTTVQIIRDTPAPVGNGSRTNLLTATFSQDISNPVISGNNGGNSATLSATTPTQIVTFASDFITFFATTDRNLSLSFSSVNPPLMLGAGNFLANFTTAGTGTFASNPAPVPFLPPTAANVSVGGRVFSALGRGVPNAVVEISDLEGNMRRARTNSFGHFRFEDVTAGNTYIFNVYSKQHSFAPAAISVNDNISDLNFIANP